MDDKSISELLNQIDRLVQEASSAPWFAHPDAKYVYGYDAGAILDRCWDDQPDADIHFAALARTALPALSRAVRAVLKECDRFQKNATSLHENPLADHTDNVRADAWRVMAAFITEEITNALEGDDDAA